MNHISLSKQNKQNYAPHLRLFQTFFSVTGCLLWTKHLLSLPQGNALHGFQATSEGHPDWDSGKSRSIWKSLSVCIFRVDSCLTLYALPSELCVSFFCFSASVCLIWHSSCTSSYLYDYILFYRM